MTITEAIKVVLKDHPEGLTTKEIYEDILHRNLYTFGAKNPLSVVNGLIRRHCFGLDFPTAYPIKIFKIVGYQGKKLKFYLYDESTSDTVESQAAPRRDSAEYLPEEKIELAYKEHFFQIKQQVLDYVLDNPPDFFEHLVVELLLKMGYGYDKTSGTVTGRPHDGGIDGIISEDKLGLDLLYIQAKRNSSNNPVRCKDLQAFIGAMEHIQKGVFITTSRFTRDAKTFAAKQQQKNIKLIDGELLAELLVKYEVGISTVQKFSVYRINTEYFSS